MMFDHFRLELTRTSLTLYVNGRAYFRQTARPDANIPGLPEGQLLPDELFEQDTYTYFTDWHNYPRDQAKLVRFHWGRIAVNPSTGPSASPSFCLGEPENTCPLE